MKNPVKIGIFGLYRGGAFIKNILACNADLVAVCDRDEIRLKRIAGILGKNVALYRDFEAFINHPGLEAICLCNTFDQHTPFAVRALEKNIHVLSEYASNGTMAEGVALVRAAERSSAIYMLAENFPFMKFNLELGRIFKSGALGKLLFAEGEYNHPQGPNSHAEIKALRPHEKHWRNYLPRSYFFAGKCSFLPQALAELTPRIPPAGTGGSLSQLWMRTCLFHICGLARTGCLLRGSWKRLLPVSR